MRKVAALVFMGLFGCDGEAEEEAVWYLGCGDPVCADYTGPFDGIGLCEDDGIVAGDACDVVGDTCDPVDSCNALLQCATSDPTQQTGGCPVSLAKHKQDIQYLDGQARQTAAQEVRAMKLASWRYTGSLDDGKTHLGFIIDDAPGSAAVAADGKHVDLYGYTSLAIATIQEQQAQIDALEVRLKALEAQCK